MKACIGLWMDELTTRPSLLALSAPRHGDRLAGVPQIGGLAR